MNAVALLREQVEKIETLKHPPAYHPQYKIWESTTLKILQKHLAPEYAELFTNVGPNQIAMDDEEHYSNFLEVLNEQKQLLEGFIEEQERFKTSTALEIARTPSLAAYDFHPEIKRVSVSLFEDRHFAQAVEEAFKRVVQEVKRIAKAKAGLALDGDKLMNRAFGTETQTPIIVFNPLQTPEDTDEQRGIMYLFKGIVGIGNKKRHSNVVLDDPNRAIEYLALASLLMRLLELSEGN